MSEEAAQQRSERARVFRRRRATLGAIAAVVVTIAAVITFSGGSDETRSASSTAAPGSQVPSHAGKTTWLGVSGVKASWVVAENRRPGSRNWHIAPSMPPDGIQGFASRDSAKLGQNVGLYVTTAAPHFRVEAFRMGYYGGDGARSVWRSPQYDGVTQPSCIFRPTIGGSFVNMVSCSNWARSATVTITKTFVQGDYLLKLTSSAGQESYVPLTVWDPTSKAAYLIMNRTFAEAGWNAYGGYSMYQGLGKCPPGIASYPVCNRARIVSLDRPFDSGNGASDYFGSEYPLVQFCEERGLDVTYITDVTATLHPSLIAAHRALLSLSHDETWSYEERRGAVDAFEHGTNLVFFGSAAVLRHVRLQPSSIGPAREVVAYRSTAEDPLNGNGDPMQVTGNTFENPPTNLSPSRLTGSLYSGYLTAGFTAPMVVTDGSAWIYKHTGLTTGSKVDGLITSDIDHVSGAAFIPPNIQIMAHSPVPLTSAYTNQGTWDGFTYADLSYWTHPESKAGVIDTGTENWIYSLNSCSSSGGNCGVPAVRAMTANLLHLFGQGPTGTTHPSIGNRDSVQPPGS